MYAHKKAFTTTIDHLRNKQNVMQLTLQRTRLNVQRLSRPFIFRVGHCETMIRLTLIVPVAVQVKGALYQNKPKR